MAAWRDMAESPESPASANPSLARVLVHRTAIALVAILVLIVPFAVFSVISGQVEASSWAMMGGVVALLNLRSGMAIALLSVGLLTALTPVAIVSGAVPVSGAGLMAIMCFGVGLSAARGLHRGMLLIPMFLAFMIIAPPAWSGHTVNRTTTSYLLWIMLFLGGGALWAALVFPSVLRKLKIPSPPSEPPWAQGDTLVYAVTITVLCSASTLGVLIWRPGSNGAWLVLTLLAVTQLGSDQSVKRTFHRVAGTIVGVAIAGIVASVSGSEAVLLAIGLVLLLITAVIMLGPHSYFLFSVFITPTVVLFTSTSLADVPTTDVQRLVFTLIGCALLLVASGITLAWAHYQQTHVVDPASPEAGAQTAT